MVNNSRKTVIFAAALTLSLLLSGCYSVGGGTSGYRGGGCYQQSFNNFLEHTDLKKVFADIAVELCMDACNDCGPQANACSQNGAAGQSTQTSGKTVLVTDFVDIQSFVPKQQGILMGELMRGSLNSNCCFRIIQVEFAKYFKLSESGLVVLSRDVSAIKNDDYNKSECIVGTYSVMNNKLLIFVRRINTVTGKITKMVTREISYSCFGTQINYTVN